MLDYTISDVEQRKAVVEKILEENPQPSQSLLNKLSDYLISACPGSKEILTPNRAITIARREVSYEATAEKFLDGEAGLINIAVKDKIMTFRPKAPVCEADLAKHPELQDTLNAIEVWKNLAANSTGKARSSATAALIDFRKEQYTIKGNSQAPRHSSIGTRPGSHEFNHEEWMEGNQVRYSGASLLDPKVCAAILADYENLRELGSADPRSELYSLMDEFDRYKNQAINKSDPIILTITEMKIKGHSNAEIQKAINYAHGCEYISSLWKNKIPALIADKAEDAFLDWYYLNEEKGTYKTCSRCHQVKLALPKYFTINNTSRDGFYSLCKVCRRENENRKRKEKKSNERN